MSSVLPGVMAALLLGASSAVLAQQDGERFPIDAYEIRGSQLIGKDQLERLVQPFIGPARGISDIRDAQRAIEGAYQAAGYGTVRAVTPEQELTGGVVRIDVVEARIERVTVVGNAHFSESNVRAALPSLVEKNIPNVREISENVQLANENPARRVEVLLNSLNERAALEARVLVQDEAPLRVSASLDNTGNAATGRHRLGVALQHANLFGRDHVATLAYLTSPEKPEQVDIYSLSYRLPLYSIGDSLDFIAGYSSVNAGTAQTVAGPLAFNGKGRVYGVRYNHYFPRDGEFSSRLALGVDQRAYDNSCQIAGMTCGSADVDVTVRPVSLTWLGQWLGSSTRTDLYATVAQNVSGGQHAGEADFQALRSGSDADYTLWRFGFNRMQTLGGGWQVRAAVSGQYSADALVPGEQFGLAGAASVRGFEERAISTDSGVIGNLELYTPNLSGRMGISDRFATRLMFFADGASGKNNALTSATQIRNVTLGSAGVGVRVDVSNKASLRLDVANVLRSQPGLSQQRGDVRGHFALNVLF